MMKINFPNCLVDSHCVIWLCKIKLYQTPLSQTLLRQALLSFPLAYTPLLKKELLTLPLSNFVTPKLTKKALILIFSACFIIVLSACGSSGNNDTKETSKVVTEISDCVLGTTKIGECAL